MLYAIPIGVLAGLLVGGRVGRIAELQFRFAWLAVLGYILQSILFVPAVHRAAGEAAPLLYVASNALVLAVLACNARLPAMPVVALGAALNLLVIALNGGYMPADPATYAARGMTIDGLLNTRFVDQPLLAGLGDWIALPAWLPGTNVISVGDLIIGCGVAAVLALAMRGGRPGQAGPGMATDAAVDADVLATEMGEAVGPVHPRTNPGPDQYDGAMEPLRHSP